MTDTACAEYSLLIQADLDGELDAAASAALAAHVQDCRGCAGLRDRLAAQSRALRGELPRHAAPDALRAAVAAMAAPPRSTVPPPPTGFRRRSLFAGGGFVAGAAIAACLMLLVLPVLRPVLGPVLGPVGPGDAALLLSSHLRALEPGHLMDVVSTDQHTVKPWFDGRIAFSPPVDDFAKQGFPLLGGRLDYLGTRQVAVLVYGHGKHVIDVYVWPRQGEVAPRTVLDDGYRIASWSSGGFRIQAVTDADAAALDAFVALWRRGG
jgi:anti-sigma factor RsiW